MTEKEISELRRQLTFDKNNISRICGCYVNDKHEIVSKFKQSFGLLPEDEAERYLSIFKKVMSGAVGKNLTDISFGTDQVLDSDEYRRIAKLRDTALDDDGATDELYNRIIEKLSLDGSYLILTAFNVYDIPYRSKDGHKQDDASENMFSYILCALCPVVLSKSVLSYSADDKRFINRPNDRVVAAPELGFMFPAFDGRCTNIYGALYYSKDVANNHKELTDELFRTELPMPAAVQKETFDEVIGSSLEDECSLQVIQAVHAQVGQLIEEHKAARVDEPLTVSKYDVRNVLSSCGVSDEHLEAFEADFDKSFGKGADVIPKNIVDTKHFDIHTPDVVIKVNPERTDLVTTKIIDDCKYILIRADDTVKINGIEINIKG